MVPASLRGAHVERIGPPSPTSAWWCGGLRQRPSSVPANMQDVIPVDAVKGAHYMRMSAIYGEHRRALTNTSH